MNTLILEAKVKLLTELVITAFTEGQYEGNWSESETKKQLELISS